MEPALKQDYLSIRAECDLGRAHVAGLSRAKWPSFVITKIRDTVVRARPLDRHWGFKTDRSRLCRIMTFSPLSRSRVPSDLLGVRVISPFFGRERPGTIRRWNPD